MLPPPLQGPCSLESILGLGTGTRGDTLRLTTVVIAFIGVVRAVGDAITEVLVGDAVGTQGAGEVSQ